MFEIDEMNNSIHPVPLMELHTEVAKFDNFIGEITCPSEVNITSPSQTLVGRQLSIRFNDLEERIELLHLAELDYIEILPINNRSIPSPTPLASLPSSKPIPSLSSPASLPSSKPITVHDASHRIHAAAAGDEIEYYIVTLSDNVKVIQGNQVSGREARGNILTIAFSSESKTSSKQKTKLEESKSPMQTRLFVQTIPATIIATTLANTQPETTQSEFTETETTQPENNYAT